MDPSHPDTIPPSPLKKQKREPAKLSSEGISRVKSLRILVLLPDSQCNNSTSGFRLRDKGNSIIRRVLSNIPGNSLHGFDIDWQETDNVLRESNSESYKIQHNSSLLYAVSGIVDRMLTEPNFNPGSRGREEALRTVAEFPTLRLGSVKFGRMSRFHQVCHHAKNRQAHISDICSDFDLIIVGPCHFFDRNRNTPDFGDNTTAAIQMLSELSLSGVHVFPPLSVLRYVTQRGTNPSSKDKCFPCVPPSVQTRPGSSWDDVANEAVSSRAFSKDPRTTSYVAKSTQESSSRSVMILSRPDPDFDRWSVTPFLGAGGRDGSENRERWNYPPSGIYSFERLHSFRMKTFRTFAVLPLTPTSIQDLDMLLRDPTSLSGGWMDLHAVLYCFSTETSLSVPRNPLVVTKLARHDFHATGDEGQEENGTCTLITSFRYLYRELGSVVIGLPFRLDLVYPPDRLLHSKPREVQPCMVAQLALFPCCESFLQDSVRDEDEVLSLAFTMFRYIVHHIGQQNTWPS